MIKIQIDSDTDEIITPVVNDKNLVDTITKFLGNSRFCHEGWINYPFYHREAAQHIVNYIEKFYEKK